MIKETVVTTPTHMHPCHHVSWTAIFVGALVGMGLSFLLGLFGTAIGLSVFHLGANGDATLAIGGLIGILICIIVSMLVSGYAAGYLGRLYCVHRHLGILYGFATWTVALLLSALLTTHMGSYISTYSNAMPSQSGVMQGMSSAKGLSASSTGTKATTNGTTAAANSQSPVTVQSSPNASQQVITVNATPGSLAMGAFIIFVLFFVGAFFSCVGACWGMGCHGKRTEVEVID